MNLICFYIDSIYSRSSCLLSVHTLCPVSHSSCGLNRRHPGIYSKYSNCAFVSEGSSTGSQRVILHFDMDCFYAQVEMIRNPALRTKPLGKTPQNINCTALFSKYKIYSKYSMSWYSLMHTKTH